MPSGRGCDIKIVNKRAASAALLFTILIGNAALAAVSAGIIYGMDKEAYLNKSDTIFDSCLHKIQNCLIRLNEANKILENGILSKNEKATIDR